MGNSIIEARDAFYENYPVHGGGLNPVIYIPYDPEESARLTEVLRGTMWDIKLNWEQFFLLTIREYLSRSDPHKKQNRPAPLPTG